MYDLIITLLSGSCWILSLFTATKACNSEFIYSYDRALSSQPTPYQVLSGSAIWAYLGQDYDFNTSACSRQAFNKC